LWARLRQDTPDLGGKRMAPVLVNVGPYPVYSYGVCILAGTILLFVLAGWLARAAGRPREHTLPVAMGVLVGAFVGARLSHLLVEPHKLEQLLVFTTLFRPGTPGNILGIILGGYLGGMAVRASLGLPSTGNFFAPALAAASVVWRLGCTLAGCCHGVETDLPWGIALQGKTVHPTMIYELLFNLLVLGPLLYLRPRIKRDNALFYLYLAGYTFLRFWLEFIRTYPRLYGGLTGIQVICIAVWIWLAIWWWRQRSAAAPEASVGGRNEAVSWSK
jgi:phosphatidylglycerol:prolipoprotein diacylglycerol transferase